LAEKVTSFTVGNIHFFVVFFLVVEFFDFMPILVLAFIAAQTAAVVPTL